MANEQSKDTRMVSMNEIIEQIPYADESTIRKRFARLLKFMDYEGNVLKDENGDYAFYLAEAISTRIILEEMGEPFLQQVMSKKKRIIKASEIFQEAAAFRERMLAKVDEIPDEEVRQDFLQTVEHLSAYHLKQVGNEIIEKIRDVGAHLETLDYEARLMLLQEINNGIDRWIEERLNK